MKFTKKFYQLNLDKSAVWVKLLKSMNPNSASENIIGVNVLKGNGFLVERGSNRCFLVCVAERSSDALIPLIKKYIAPGTTIISDCWKSYQCISEEGYKHLTVNHSVTFKDFETGACINAVEGLWSCVKRQLPECGRSKAFFSSYLGEFMWRRLRAGAKDRFETFLQDISRVYPPTSNDVNTKDDANVNRESDV